jgi:ribosomal protein L24E
VKRGARMAVVLAVLAFGLAAAGAAGRPVLPAAAEAAAPPEPTEELLAFGDAPFHGSTRSFDLRRPVVTMAAAPNGSGYWVVAADGGIFAFGSAPFLGSTGGIVLNTPIVGMAPTESGLGYWLVASDGGIFAFGDAPFLGSTGAMVLNRPIVGMAATASGRGYWLVASDGGIFAFGDAPFLGSTGGIVLNRPITGMAATGPGDGYWLVASDGGIFSFGRAPFLGSTGGMALNQPIVAMARTPTSAGYWMAAADGGLFTFGDAPFLGGAGGVPLAGRVVALVPTASGLGYWMAVQRRPVLLPGSPAAWILTDRATGQALLEHRADARRRPASTTKMLTALVAVRRLPADATIPISARAAGVVPTEAGAKAGEVWSLTDALHGLLLPSGNDIAYAIAERVAGTVEAFGTEMQKLSVELGLSTASTWQDPAGLDFAAAVGGGNWSTARDLARLGRAVVDDPALGRVVGTASYTYAGPYGTPHTVTNTNELVRVDPTVYGVKTGTTPAAGACLVAAAGRRGREVVSVVLGAGDRSAATSALLDLTPVAAAA